MSARKNSFQPIQNPDRELVRLKKSLAFFQALALILACAVAGGIFFWRQSAVQEDSRPRKKIVPPLSAEVQRIIDPLGYSGIPYLLGSDSKISFSPQNRTWTFHNIHQFNPDGTVKLAQGKFGLCGDLAAYVYSRIKPMLNPRISIEFLHVAESGFFLDPRASHIALIITEPGFFGAQSYILDPSFKKYGPIEDFDDYNFFERSPVIPFVILKNTDEVFPVGTSTPLLIKKDFLVALLIDSQNGRLDKDNFIFALTATRRYKFAGRHILAIRKIDGRTEILENRHLAALLFKPEEYARIRARILELYQTLS